MALKKGDRRNTGRTLTVKRRDTWQTLATRANVNPQKLIQANRQVKQLAPAMTLKKPRFDEEIVKQPIKNQAQRWMQNAPAVQPVINPIVQAVNRGLVQPIQRVANTLSEASNLARTLYPQENRISQAQRWLNNVGSNITLPTTVNRISQAQRWLNNAGSNITLPGGAVNTGRQITNERQLLAQARNAGVPLTYEARQIGIERDLLRAVRTPAIYTAPLLPDLGEITYGEDTGGGGGGGYGGRGGYGGGGGGYGGYSGGYTDYSAGHEFSGYSGGARKEYAQALGLIHWRI